MVIGKSLTLHQNVAKKNTQKTVSLKVQTASFPTDLEVLTRLRHSLESFLLHVDHPRLVID